MASSWERLGSTTLGSAGDQIDVTIAARKYLIIRVHAEGDGAAKLRMRFNDDSGSNYSYRASPNGGSDGNSSSGGTEMEIDNVNLDEGEQAMNELYVINVADKEKICINHHINNGGVGADNTPDRVEQTTKWVNTSAQIVKVSLINPMGGDYAVGSTVTVWGTDDQGSTTTDHSKASITNVPAGTRYEETDTRKIFHSRVQTGGAASGNAWVEKGEVVSAALRGIFAGGNPTSATHLESIDYFTIQTLGNAADFGDLSVGRGFAAAFADSTRGVIGGGDTGSRVNVIDYITVATLGNATDFGDTYVRMENSGCADATRGCMWGGTTASGGNYSNTIDYVTIQTTGNATDFGDISSNRGACASCASATRGIVAGGYVTYASHSNAIEYITIQTTGNSTDFGDILANNYTLGACADATRGIIGGGNAGVVTNVIQYITIASTGNATDFGDLTIAKQNTDWCADSTRGVCGGGHNSGDRIEMDYITIQTLGNAADFGDMTATNANRGGLAA